MSCFLTSERAGVAALWLLAAVLLGGFLAAGYADPSTTARAVALAGALALGAWALLVRALERDEMPPGGPLAVAVAGGLAAVIVAGGLLQLPLPAAVVTALVPAWASVVADMKAAGIKPPAFLPLGQSPHHGWHSWTLAVASLGVFLGARLLAESTRQRRQLVRLLIVLFLVEGMLGLASLATGADRAAGGARNPNHHAAMLLMLAPLALARRNDVLLLRSYRHRPTADQAVLAGTLIALALLGWAGALSRASIGIAFVAALLWAAWELRSMPRSPRLWRLGSTMGIAFAVVVGGAMLFGAALQDRARGLATGDLRRTELAVATLREAAATRGVGLGLSGAAFALDRSITSTPKRPVWSHNDWVQVVSELGLLGAAGLAATGVLAWRRLRAAHGYGAVLRNPRMMEPARAMLLGMGTIGVHSLVDFPLRIPLVAWSFLVLAAVADAELSE